MSSPITAWPAELQFGVLDAICEGTLSGSQPTRLMVIKKSSMGDGQRAVALLTDGGSRYCNTRSHRYFLRCILKDCDSAMNLSTGTILELAHWMPNTVAKNNEKIIVALTVRKIGQFDGLSPASIESMFIKHPLNQGMELTSQSTAASGPILASNVSDGKAMPPSYPPSFNDQNSFNGAPNPNMMTGGGVASSLHSTAPTASNPYMQLDRADQQSGSDAAANSWGPQGRRQPMQSTAGVHRAAPYGPVVRRSDNNAFFVPINGITTFIAKWQIKSRVMSKAEMRNYNTAKGEGKLFSVDLVGSDGGEIRATFFNKAAEKFYPILELNSVYIFSKGTVKAADKRFNKLNHSCELQFGDDALIQAVEDEADIPKMNYNFVKIANLNDKKKNDYVDILAVVIKSSETAQITIRTSGELKDKRDWTLLDDSCCTIELTLWGNKVDILDDDALKRCPVVAIKGARVDEFQGRKLSSSYSTMIDPCTDHPAAAELWSWYENTGRHAQIQSLSNVGPQLSRNEKRSTLSDILDAVKSIKAGGELEDKGLWFTTVAVLHSIDTERQYFWTACPTCNKKVRDTSAGDTFATFASDNFDRDNDSDAPASFFCQTCNKNVDKPIKKFVLNVELQDSTTSLRCVALGDNGQSLMGVDVDTIENAKIHSPDEHGKDFDDYFLWKRQEESIFRIQAKSETYNDDTRIKYRMYSAEPLNKHFAAEAERRMSVMSNILGLPPLPDCLNLNQNVTGGGMPAGSAGFSY